MDIEIRILELGFSDSKEEGEWSEAWAWSAGSDGCFVIASPMTEIASGSRFGQQCAAAFLSIRDQTDAQGC